MLQEERKEGRRTEVCYTYTVKENLTGKEIQKEFGDIYAARDKIRRFLARGNASIIPLEQLSHEDVAFFENREEEEYGYADMEPHEKPFNLEDILVDFKVDMAKGTVTAKKLYKFQEKWFMKTRKYDMRNYGKTWRAWDAMPKEHYTW